LVKCLRKKMITLQQGGSPWQQQQFLP
jgi:hypothetical protein